MIESGKNYALILEDDITILKDIKFLCDGENEDISVSYDTASGVCTITLNNYLKEKSSYELIIPKEVYSGSPPSAASS